MLTGCVARLERATLKPVLTPPERGKLGEPEAGVTLALLIERRQLPTPTTKSVAGSSGWLAGAHFSVLPALRGTFCATAQAPEPMTQEMRNAVKARRMPAFAKEGPRFRLESRIAGSQMSSVYSETWMASAHAAARGSTPKRTPRPEAIWPAPASCAQKAFSGSHGGTRSIDGFR